MTSRVLGTVSGGRFKNPPPRRWTSFSLSSTQIFVYLKSNPKKFMLYLSPLFFRKRISQNAMCPASPLSFFFRKSVLKHSHVPKALNQQMIFARLAALKTAMLLSNDA
jgi:hypothetical protein